MYDYPVTVVEADGAHLVFCPDLPEMHSVGDTVEEALREAGDGIITALSIC
ncbi:type II toxin-antitoxin system HicB family antitoxin [Microbulbifer taiwanensis]|uniref:type II toxin-antitoxin system HicB family antitoxin n=1 Tax=Microbulbifer taiwanensis TaxID=986746 RepID=UPI003607B811